MITENVSVKVDLTTILNSNGFEIYLGHNIDPIRLDLQEEIEEYLDCICNEYGKVYIESSDDLDQIIDTFRICLTKLENAKSR